MKKRLWMTLAASLAALCMTCGLTFASQAVVDQYTDKYEHQSRFDDCIVIDGIDVSEWQENIDYDAVKKQGIDYVFIRVGKSASGENDPFISKIDTQFEAHYQAAKDAGLMVGVYYFSAATTLSEAETEAKNVITWLNDRQLDLPVVMDYEECERVSAAKIDMTSNALRFLNYIEANSDYDAMFYTARWLMDDEFISNLIDSKYPIWISQYSYDHNINSYTRPFEFWQYTDSGQISGINGPVDCNFWYFDANNYPASSGKTAISKATAKLSVTTYTYNGSVKTPAVTLTYNGATLRKGTDYQLSYIKNVKAGDAYALVKGIGKYDGYKVVQFGVKIPLTASNCTISDIPDQTCTGSALKPAVKVYYQGKLLKKDVDYTVTYNNTKKVGTGTATIKGIDQYSGTLKKTFAVKIGKPTSVKSNLRAAKTTGYDDVKVTWKKVPGASFYRVYYKKASSSSYQSYKKADGGDTTSKIIYGLTPGTKYNFKVIAYAPDGSKGSYSSVTSTTTLKKVSQNSVKKYSSSKVKVSWVNISGETGYEISRSSKKSGTYVVATVKSTSAKSKTLTVPTKGKRYYYKVRAYKLVDGVRVRGPWSEVKSYTL